MARSAFDDSRWPRVEPTWPAGNIDDAGLDEVLAIMERCLERGDISGIRVDTRTGGSMAAAAPRASPRSSAPARRSCRARSRQSSSRDICSAHATALGWLLPPANPQKVCTPFEEADACSQRCSSPRKPRAHVEGTLFRHVWKSQPASSFVRRHDVPRAT